MTSTKDQHFDGIHQSNNTAMKGTMATVDSVSMNPFADLPMEIRPKRWDVWALGITIVIGGQYFSWNLGLGIGFGGYFIATFLIGTAYICLCLCTAELTSTLPFTGGAYGLARCTLGFYPGFMIGCCESIEYIVYVATSAISLGGMILLLQPTWTNYQPIIWFLFYLSAVVIHVLGGRFFWRFNMVMAVVSLLIVLLYCFGSFSQGDFNHYAHQGIPWFSGGINGFMKVFVLPAWFYVGVESLNLIPDEVAEPKKNIPQGQVACMLTLFVTSMLVLFCTVALPQGIDGASGVFVVFSQGTGCFL